VVQPWFAILGAKDDVNDHLAQRLRHAGIMTERVSEVNCAFSAGAPGVLRILGRCSRLLLNSAPLALNRCRWRDATKLIR
jgi:hypothetical protein